MKTSKKKILLIVNKRNEISVKIMKNLAEGFIDNDHEVEIISNEQRLSISRFVKKIIDEMYHKKYDMMISSSKIVTLGILLLLRFRKHKPIIFTFDTREPYKNYSNINLQIKKTIISFANRWNYIIKFSKEQDYSDDLKLNLPFINKTVGLKYKKQVDHEWYNKGYQILVSKGDVTRENDYKTIVLALYELLKVVETRLIIIGSLEKDPKEVAHLNELIRRLGLKDYIDFIPDSINTYSYISNASLYISVAKQNNFPEEIVHVLGCGTPVISMEGNSYDMDILDNGKYGTLLKEEDFMGLNEAIKGEISKVHYPIVLVKRAMEYSVEKWITYFEEILDEYTIENNNIKEESNFGDKSKKAEDG